MDPAPTPALAPPSPWQTIWFSPRRTIRNVTSTDVPPTLMPVLGATFVALLLSGANLALAQPEGLSYLPRAAAIIACMMAAFVGPGPFVLAWYARQQGGVGRHQDIRQAVAWGYAPIAVSALFWIPLWIATDGSAYTLESSLTSVAQLVTLPLFLIADVGARLWSVIITVVMLAEVQRASLWRGIENMVMLWLFALLCLAVFALSVKAFAGFIA